MSYKLPRLLEMIRVDFDNCFPGDSQAEADWSEVTVSEWVSASLYDRCMMNVRVWEFSISYSKLFFKSVLD